uniref:TadE family protein n=1 Tax=Solibacter usitatus (strain Ellin6076) TaxID=234267 RepID=Q01XW1_SOLUE
MAESNNSKRRRRRGVELIEFTLVMMPLLGFIFLVIDLGWTIYKRATLQFAVREGCRYAVINQLQPLKDSNGNNYGMIDSVKYVVQQRAMGFLGSTPSDPGYATIQVRFYDPNSSLTTAVAMPPDCTSTIVPNKGGYLVEVSVEHYKSQILGAIYKGSTPLDFVARSSDRMEADPSSGIPKALTCP